MMNKGGSRSIRIKEEISEDLATLLRSKNQILEWKEAIAKRVAHCEDVYLKETVMGNIIRGFDPDSMAVREKNRGTTKAEQKESDEKEKLFTGSSYPIWLERQKAAALKLAQVKQEAQPSMSTSAAGTTAVQDKAGITASLPASGNGSGPPQKKQKA